MHNTNCLTQAMAAKDLAGHPTQTVLMLLSDLHQTVSALEEQSEVIEKNLSPILMDVPNDPEGVGACSMSHLCQVSQALLATKQRLESLYGRKAVMLSRVQL